MTIKLQFSRLGMGGYDAGSQLRYFSLGHWWVGGYGGEGVR